MARKIDINDIPEILRRDVDQISEDWEVVGEHDISSYTPHPSRKKTSSTDPLEWWNIYRSPDGVLYRVKCWDGTYTSFQPETHCRNGSLEDVVIIGYAASSRSTGSWSHVSGSEEPIEYMYDPDDYWMP